MICYKDKTYCEAKNCIKFNDCPRSLTEAVKKAAADADLPLAYFENPTLLQCYEPKQD